MDRQVTQFVERTGATNKEARQFLQKCGNSVDEAARQYELIRSGIPPPGPIKNLPAMGSVRVQPKVEVNGCRSSPNNSNRNDSSNIRVIVPRNSSDTAKQSSPQVSNKVTSSTASSSPVINSQHHQLPPRSPRSNQLSQNQKIMSSGNSSYNNVHCNSSTVAVTSKEKDAVLTSTTKASPQENNSIAAGGIALSAATPPPVSTKPAVQSVVTNAAGGGRGSSVTITSCAVPSSPPVSSGAVVDNNKSHKVPRNFPSLADSPTVLDTQRKSILQNVGDTSEQGSVCFNNNNGTNSTAAAVVVMGNDIGDVGLVGASLDDTMENTFVLPDLSAFEPEFREYLMRTLVEKSTLIGLESTGYLNWWTDCGLPLHLIPMATDGDGNCLLHAASLAMWGFHDRRLTLRTHLHSTIHEGRVHEAMYRRWRFQQTLSNMQLGLTLSSDQWAAEWSNLLKLTSLKPKREGSVPDGSCTENGVEVKGEESESKVYESLEEFHVFVLAHVLRRPIIVIADTVLRDVDNEAIAPIPFGGIYLPVERSPSECYRSPLLLAYDAAHFSALVTSSGDKAPGDLMPLVDPAFSLLPLHFVVDPGHEFNWEEADDKKMAALELSLQEKVRLLQRFLDVRLSLVSDDSDTETPASAIAAASSSGQGAGGNASSAKATQQLVLNNHSSNNDAAVVTGNGKKLTRGLLNRSVSEDSSSDAVKKAAKKSSNPFSSLRRTVSKKLRQHLPLRNKKNGGADSPRVKKNNEAEPPGVAETTATVASAKEPQNAADVYEETVECLTTCQGDRLVCARLTVKLPEYYDDMVNTFLRSNRESFDVAKRAAAAAVKDDRKKVDASTGPSSAAGSRAGTLRSTRDGGDAISALLLATGGAVVTTATLDDDWEDDDDLLAEDDSTAKPTSCINQNCDGIGTADRFYLCEACYDRQKREELDFRVSAAAASTSQAAAAGVDGQGSVNGERRAAAPAVNGAAAHRLSNWCGLDNIVSDTVNVSRSSDRYYNGSAAMTGRMQPGEHFASGGGVFQPADPAAMDIDCRSLDSPVTGPSVRQSKSYDVVPRRILPTPPVVNGAAASGMNGGSKQYVTLVSVGRDMSEPPLRAEFERLHSTASSSGRKVDPLGATTGNKSDVVKAGQVYKV